MRRKKKSPLPAAQACGLTVTWLAEGEDRAGWSQTSAPGTTALNLACSGEAYCPQTGTGGHTEEQQREAGQERGWRRKERRQEEIRKHSKTVGGGKEHLFYTPSEAVITLFFLLWKWFLNIFNTLLLSAALCVLPSSCYIPTLHVSILILCCCCNDPVSHKNI